MKFPLFNKKNTTKAAPLSDQKNTFDEKFEQLLPIPASAIKINYTLVCNHGRSGENYAAKLAEEDGGNVTYMKTRDKMYIIKVITEPLHNANEDTVREFLSRIADNGTKYNCFLADWEYIRTDN